MIILNNKLVQLTILVFSFLYSKYFIDIHFQNYISLFVGNIMILYICNEYLIILSYKLIGTA